MVGARIVELVVLVLLIVSASACQRFLGIEDVVPPDEPMLLPECGLPESALQCREFPAAHFDACEICAPSPRLELDIQGVYVYNTDSGTLRDPNGSTITHAMQTLEQDRGEALLISVEGLEIAAEAVLRAEGSRPLIIASWNDVSIVGDIDVSTGMSSEVPGAGADRDCAGSSAGAPGDSGESAGAGGGGGGYQSSGGRGGDADSDHPFSVYPNGGRGGDAMAQPEEVRGGCAGADGGNGRATGNPPGGAGGSGGGAIQITAKVQLLVDGRILAYGAGGGAGSRGEGFQSDGSGGGGGGSGGYIGLEAPRLIIDTAVLTANGGSGGEGADYGDDGLRGNDGSLNTDPAPGGIGGAFFGGDGGDGGSRALEQGQPPHEHTAGGGGGGGGGVGFILFRNDTFESRGFSSISPRSITVE